ncbi:D-alanine--D-alanine ligase family protein [Arcanobacterium hippocoleae]|uniref:D-alanine--D-alanine ligase n=1 Tax=Arcanobacterium hippocoleae TaxID=149017 RepID=A0ABU1T1E9_9ACTO|nr:ATP-grasp domain-containing protein [Arcanobacterium hippocoleae]MDR6939116.1 D-alanine-D-alanine ligase [Arcanobacterium hippocoleae]
MERPLTVAVIAGGLTHEREISLISGRRIAGALMNSGIQAKVLDLDSQLLQRLKALEPDICWPTVHGASGEDGSLQDLLDLAGDPFVGTGADGCRVAYDKSVAAAALSEAGVAVPDSIAIPQSLFREVGVNAILDLFESRFGFPLVVKPTRAGSSMGLTIVESRAQLPGAMVDCFAYGEVALVQQFIAGREFGVAVADFGQGAQALPPVEIRAAGIYDYDARYNPGRVEYFVAEDLAVAGVAEVASLAQEVHRVLKLRHLSRTDVILDASGKAWFIDVNTAPGMTETSIFPLAAGAYAQTHGIAPDQVYLEILKAAALGE